MLQGNLLRCMGTCPCLVTIYIKGNNFFDFLFASLDEKIHQKSSLLLTLWHSEWPKLHRVFAILSAIGLKKKISPRGAKSFLKKLTPTEKGGKNKCGRNAFPGSVPIPLKIMTLISLDVMMFGT